MKLTIIQQTIRYWLKTAEHDFVTMQALEKTKRYSDALFFGHIVLEKLLKAHVVKATHNHAPYIHDLVRLAALTELQLSTMDTTLLNEVSDFNIRARYPEDKLEFYQRCTKAFATPYIDQITILYHKLCQTLKQKKS